MQDLDDSDEGNASGDEEIRGNSDDTDVDAHAEKDEEEDGEEVDEDLLKAEKQ